MADRSNDNGLDLGHQIETRRDEVAAVAGVVDEFASPAARKRMRRKMKTLGDRAQHALVDAEHRVDDASATIQDRIRERPVQSALLAFGLGIAFSKLFLGRDR
jgi:hypothetical protein